MVPGGSEMTVVEILVEMLLLPKTKRISCSALAIFLT